MGATWSEPEDVRSIVSDGDYTKKVMDSYVQLATTVLKNLKDISDAVPGPVGLGGKLVSVLLVDIIGLGKDQSLDMAKLLDQIQKIVHDELTKEKVAEVQAALNGTTLWLGVEFKNRIEAKWSKEKLYHELDAKVKHLVEDVIDVVMAERFSEAGLPVFVLAANLHLGMLLDLSRLDPDPEVRGDPRRSTHFSDARDRAKKYVKHTNNTTDGVLQKRADKVVSKVHHYTSTGVRGGVPRGPSYRWEDLETGQKGSDTSIGDRMQRRKIAVRKQLYEDLGKPNDVAENWKQMIDTFDRCTVAVQ